MSATVQFTLEAFVWNSDQPEIWLHCDVMVCDPYEEDCEKDAEENPRRRRSNAESKLQQTIQTMKIGPIRITEF